MKTYKQMADDVLKRRDEYFEQKQDRKVSRGVISAAVAACAVVVVILFGTIIGGVMKSPVTEPGTDAPPAASSRESTDLMTDETETAPEDTDDTECETTAEITEETAEEETKADEIKANLVAQADHPVKWIACVNTMKEFGADTFVEAGPGKTLCGFNRRIDKALKSMNVENLESLQKTLDYFKEVR